MVKRFIKKSKNKKLRIKNKISRKQLGGDMGLLEINDFKIDRIPNGIFNKIGNIKYAHVKILLAILVGINPNELNKINDDKYYISDGLVLKNPSDADNKNHNITWWKITNKNLPLFVDISFGEKQYGLDWYLKNEKDDLMNELSRRGKRNNEYNYTLIYYYKLDNYKRFLFKVDVEIKEKKKVNYDISLLNEITGKPINELPINTGYINVSTNNNLNHTF